MMLIISAAFLLVVCEAQISQNCVGAACGQNNVAASAGSQISQNCASSSCIQNNIGRKKREIADAILALTEETIEVKKHEIQKREAEAQIFQNCAGSTCNQNNVGAGSSGTRISQNCVGSSCNQNNFGRRKREVVAKLLEEAHKVANEQAEAEALEETQSRKKRSFTHLLP